VTSPTLLNAQESGLLLSALLPHPAYLLPQHTRVLGRRRGACDDLCELLSTVEVAASLVPPGVQLRLLEGSYLLQQVLERRDNLRADYHAIVEVRCRARAASPASEL
jgi:hypothetical protein